MTLTQELIGEVVTKQSSRHRSGMLHYVDSALLAALLAAIITAAIECLKERGYTAEDAADAAESPWFWQRWRFRRLCRREADRVCGILAVHAGPDIDDLADDLLSVAGSLTPDEVRQVSRECHCEL